MGVELAKGANTGLGPPVPRRVSLGLSWQLPPDGPAPLELDAQVILLGRDGRVADDSGLLFFSQLDPAPTGGPAPAAGTGSGTGSGSVSGGDDVEQVVVDLAAVPAEVARILISAAIYAAVARGQSFGQVRRAAITVADADSGVVLARHVLGGATGVETAMVFGELYRHGGGWKFRAVGQGYAGGLGAVARDVGVRV